MRHFSLMDHFLNQMDQAVRTLLPPQARVVQRECPGQLLEDNIEPAQKKHVAGLMRVNHAGEVCAQALYQGQALTAQLNHIKKQMNEAAAEENDHLAWCEQRLRELNSHTSVLNPLWYLGSLLIGALAGLAGDRYSLGFVAETERQVSVHLQKHLQNIPQHDKKTEMILQQMHEDETQHAILAQEAGAWELPTIIKNIMHETAKLMTKTSYYV